MDRPTAPATPSPAVPGDDQDARSDWKVVLQFFVVPLALVAVLVTVFFGLQFLRSRRPDPGETLKDLEAYRGFLSAWVGDLKRWQSGYDLSLMMQSEDRATIDRMLPALAEAFRQAGRDNDVKLRRYLALALARARKPEAGAVLRDGLGDPDPEVRLYSAWGLADLGDRGALDDLRKAAGDPDAGVRKVAIFALGHLRDEDAAPLLVRALADGEVDVRWNAALALAQLRRAEAAPVLRDLLEASAFEAAGGDRPEALEPRRQRALNAVRGLALVPDAESPALLRRAADGASDPAVREAARMALDVAGVADSPAGRSGQP